MQLAKLEDMPDVAQVARTSRLEALPYLPDLHTIEEDILFYSQVVFKEHDVYIARDEGTQKIVGFIAFNSEWVSHLYLLPEAQNLGLGTRLLNIAKEKQTNLKLWTFQKNEKALRFYLKHGFTEVKRTDGQDNEEKEPDVLLAWNK